MVVTGWAKAGTTLQNEVYGHVASVLAKESPAVTRYALVLTAAMAVEELAGIDVSVDHTVTEDDVNDAWVALGGAAKAWVSTKRGTASERPAWLKSLATQALQGAFAAKSVSLDRRDESVAPLGSPLPHKSPSLHSVLHTHLDSDTEAAEQMEEPAAEIRVRHKKCPGCTMRTSNCICQSLVSAKTAAQIVKAVKSSLGREAEEEDIPAPTKSTQKRKALKLPATEKHQEPKGKTPAPESDSDLQASESEAEGTASFFGGEGRDSTYAFFWAKPSRMQDPTLWLSTMFEDGELNVTAFQHFSAQLEKFAGFKEDPQSSSDRLRNALIFNLQAWVRFAPVDPPAAYLEVATFNLDQLMIQKAFDRGNSKAATKFALRLSASEHSDRYRGLWDKMEKESDSTPERKKSTSSRAKKAKPKSSKDEKEKDKPSK